MATDPEVLVKGGQKERGANIAQQTGKFGIMPRISGRRPTSTRHFLFNRPAE
jgi:hypothetical protein